MLVSFTSVVLPAALVRPLNVTVAVTVSVALRLTPLNEAEMSTALLALTGTVLIVKLALFFPAGTVTLAGTVATAVLPLVSVTTVPPAGAAALKVTVPVEGFPPATLVGLSATVESVTGGTVGGKMVCSATWLTPPAVA